MAGKLIIPILLLLLVSNLISASKLTNVYYRFLTNEQLTRIPEFFTGREFTGSQLFYRTSNKKEGLYFFIPLNAQVDEIPDQVKVILMDNPKGVVLIQGHASEDGGSSYNMTLSRKRAEAVKAKLVELGIDSSRLEVEAFGETRPKGDNSTSVGRANSRRVEFTAK